MKALKNKYHFRIIIKCKFGDETINLINDMLNDMDKPKKEKVEALD